MISYYNLSTHYSSDSIVQLACVWLEYSEESLKITHRLLMILNLFSSSLVLCILCLGASCKITFFEQAKGLKKEGGLKIDSLKKGA